MNKENKKTKKCDYCKHESKNIRICDNCGEELVKICEYCKVPVVEHKKCNYCGILLHDKKMEYQCRCGKQHSLEDWKGYCVGCSN